MNELMSVYSQLQGLLENPNCAVLEQFKEKTLESNLSKEERAELSEKIFTLAQEIPFEETLFIDLLAFAEELKDKAPETLCRSGSLYLQYSLLRNKRQFILLALDKFSLADELDPQFFNTYPKWYHVWGNVFAALAHHLSDATFLERALQKYEMAEKGGKNYELYWDWAEAWKHIGTYSKESADFQKAIEKYAFAEFLGANLPHFRIDYSEALHQLGMLTGNPLLLESALKMLREVISNTYRPEESSSAYDKAWVCCATVAKSLYELTRQKEHFDAADTLIHEAILANPKHADLWICWGELHLDSAWMTANIKEVESALDKLTSLKVKEIDPIKLSALLGKGLVFLGFFLEDLKLLKDGRERILKALEVLPDSEELLYSAGMAHFTFGNYFSDLEEYAKAISCFHKALEIDTAAVKNWHGLFQAYFAMGMQEKEPFYMQKAMGAIERLCKLRPLCGDYVSEWGNTLLRLRQMEPDSSVHLALIEEAIEKLKRGWELRGGLDTLYSLGCAYDMLGDVTANEEDYEKSIEILTKVYEKLPEAEYVRYHLGLALSHYGELTADVESLYQAKELLQSVIKSHGEDEILYCDLGYTLLNLAVLTQDPLHLEQSEELKREAEKILVHAAELGDGNACYHLACLYALSDYSESALKYLKLAEQREALPTCEDLESDEWLAQIRELEAFQEFLSLRRKDDE